MTEADDARDAEVIRRAIDEVLTPLVRRDGAELTLVSIRDGVAELRAGGTLRACPGRHWTARGVVLPTLRRALPTLRDVLIV